MSEAWPQQQKQQQRRRSNRATRAKWWGTGRRRGAGGTGASAQTTGHAPHLGRRGVGVRRIACKARAVAQGQHAAWQVEPRAVEVRRGRQRHVDVVDAASPREVRRNAVAKAKRARHKGDEGGDPPAPHAPRLGLPVSVRASSPPLTHLDLGCPTVYAPGLAAPIVSDQDESWR